MRVALNDDAIPIPRSARRAGLIGKLAIGVALAVPLAACGTSDRMRTSSIATDDYRVRHPILISNDTTSIDVFPEGPTNGIDRHVDKQIHTFADGYRDAGHGPITVMVPIGAGVGDARGTVAGIRRALSSAGVHVPVLVTTYPVTDPSLASPIRLSFVGLKAKLGDQCGQWPSDLGSGSTVDEWQNKQYYNFGCATQSMIAAQTADPRDLVAPRGEDPADTQTRSRGIESVRKGTDPSTTWTIHNTSIGSVGGN